MKINLEELRELSEKNRRLLEQKGREEETERKTKEEAERQARKEAEFQEAIKGLETRIKFAAERGQNYLDLEDFSPPFLNISSRMSWTGKLGTYPKTISRDRLPPLYQRVCDYCNSQGFKVTVELHNSPTRGRVYELRIYW